MDGFLVVDDERLQQLPDLQVLEMHRNGMLKLLSLHLASLATLRHMVERKARRAIAAKFSPPAAHGVAHGPL